MRSFLRRVVEMIFGPLEVEVPQEPAAVRGDGAPFFALLLPSGAPARYFAADEFRCRCGGRHGVRCSGFPSPLGPNRGIEPLLVEALEGARDALGPIHVTSGYRCPAHNAAVGGAPASKHLRGAAADIVARHARPRAVYEYLDRRSPRPDGLGLYESFVHVDFGGRDGGRLRRKAAAHEVWRTVPA